MDHASNAPPAGCGWRLCPRHNQPPSSDAMRCSACQEVCYCNAACQKKAWRFHKLSCVPPGTPETTVTEKTVAAIQAAVDAAPEGSVVKVPAGHYYVDSVALTLNKAVRLIGEGMDRVKLNCGLIVSRDAPAGGTLVVQGLSLEGTVRVEECAYDSITFTSVQVTFPPSARVDDVFEASNRGKITLDCCEIVGGADGLFINGSETKMLIRETDIECCSSRGIFANPSFTIQDSAVYNCGSYGIKGRSGWIEKGDNQIQPGPWNSFGGGSGGFF